MVKAENSQPRGRGFEPRWQILECYVMLIVSFSITLLQPLNVVYHSLWVREVKKNFDFYLRCNECSHCCQKQFVFAAVLVDRHSSEKSFSKWRVAIVNFDRFWNEFNSNFNFNSWLTMFFIFEVFTASCKMFCTMCTYFCPMTF